MVSGIYEVFTVDLIGCRGGLLLQMLGAMGNRDKMGKEWKMLTKNRRLPRRNIATCQQERWEQPWERKHWSFGAAGSQDTAVCVNRPSTVHSTLPGVSILGAGSMAANSLTDDDVVKHLVNRAQGLSPDTTTASRGPCVRK